ncbi:MAG TPA: DUF899 family protein [Chitinophagales bacterium]|nr:DUF899 family protein [Chitinophagales bacterium]
MSQTASTNQTTYEQIAAVQKEIEAKRIEIVELRSKLAPEEVKDYTLKDWNGNDVLLSSLFDERDELMVIHNMGKRCVYCTLWADGLNGFVLPLNDRMPFVVTSPDAPDVQKEFAESRDWKFKMLSTLGSTFTADLGFEPKPGVYHPGVSALIRKDGKIYRTSYDHFGPGDAYCAPWHLYDLFPKRDNEWQPKYKYAGA